MIEVEVKARVDHDRAQDILCLLGIPRVSVKAMTDTYYDTPALNLYSRGESLRIRQSIDGLELVFKGKRVSTDSRSRQEINTKIDRLNIIVDRPTARRAEYGQPRRICPDV